VALYLERLSLVGEVARCKADTDAPISDPVREKSIIYRLTKDIADDDCKLYVKDLYENIFTASKAYQSALLHRTSPTALRLKAIIAEGQQPFPVSATVACQGVLGANSYTAATKLFPISDVTFFRTFEGVFGAVAKGLCQYGVLPIENSTAGSVNEVYDLMKKYDFHIVKAIRLKINHCLAGVKGADIGRVTKVISHPQALSQCAEYLKKQGFAVTPADNTATAAKELAASGDVTTAVLCSAECAALYGLDILEQAVQDNSSNYTRFICIGKRLEVFSGSTKISVMTSLPHRPGSLNKTLSRFASIGLDLTKLESRPLADMPFEFMFYFDFDGNVFDDKIISLIAELENSSDNFTFLGSYQEII
jgi:chorismate mutase/prephenate dehydratase